MEVVAGLRAALGDANARCDALEAAVAGARAEAAAATARAGAAARRAAAAAEAIGAASDGALRERARSGVVVPPRISHVLAFWFGWSWCPIVSEYV